MSNLKRFRLIIFFICNSLWCSTMAANFNHFFGHNPQITDSSEEKEIDTNGATDSFHHFISTMEHANASIHDHSYHCIKSMQSCLNNKIETLTLLNYLIDIQSLDDRMDQWSNILICIKWLISYHQDYDNNKSIKTNHFNIFQIQGIEYKYSLLHIAAALSEVRLLQKLLFLHIHLTFSILSFLQKYPEI